MFRVIVKAYFKFYFGRILLCFIFSVLFLGTLTAQNFQWAKKTGGPGNDEGYSVGYDAAGNVYTTGYFENTIDFDPGAGVYNLTSFGSTDIFVTKFDANGNFIWARQMGGALDEIGYDIHVEADGDVFVSGYYSGTVDFDPGVGTYYLTAGGQLEAYVLKLNTFGQLDFAGQFTTGFGYWSFAKSITTDASGNMLITGYYQADAFNMIDFDPGPGTFYMNSGGQTSFICKLNPVGNFLWAKAFGCSNCEGNSIASDAAGNVYSVGDFLSSADFNPGPGTYTLTSIGGGHDVYISKLDALGNFIWAKQIGGNTSDHGNGIAIDVSGNVLVGGQFQLTSDFDPGAASFPITSSGQDDGFILKLDANGNFSWAVKLGGPTNDRVMAIDIDGSDNVYTVGHFSTTADFEPGAAIFNMSSQNSSDVFISKLNSSGNFVWAKKLSGNGTDLGNGIAVDNSGIMYVTGNFNITTDFDPGPGVFNLVSSNANDVFTLKLGVCSIQAASISVFSCGSTTINGQLYSSGGTYIQNLQAVNACDSMLTVHLTIAQPTSSTTTVTNCQSYSWQGNTYMLSGTYKDTISNVAGCDSIMTLLLTILPSSSSSHMASACNSYLWNGSTYFSSGTYIDTISNTNGCDSIMTLQLTINNASFSSSSATSCDTYTWNGNTYFSSGTYTDTFINSVGCDSIASLSLQINNSSGSITNITACESYDWNGNTLLSSGVHTDTLLNYLGCDSVVVLNLTINTIDTSVTNSDPTLTANEPGAVYQWLDCNNGNISIAGETYQIFSATSNGDYAVVVTLNGCTDTSNCHSILTTGFENINYAISATVYPNPSNEVILLELNNFNPAVRQVEILSVVGITTDIILITDHITKINITHLPAGIYFIRFESLNSPVLKFTKN